MLPHAMQLMDACRSDTATSSHYFFNSSSEYIQQAVAKIGEISSKAGLTSMTSGALSWLLQQPSVASVIVGCSREEQVLENTRVVQLDLVRANCRL